VLRVLHDPGSSEDLEADARRLHREMLRKNNLPRLPGATRAMVPSWCDSCSERCWGPERGGFSICQKCRGEGKIPIGFRD